MTTTMVPGGTGMLGSAVVRRLLREGDQVVVLGRSTSAYYLAGRGIDLDSVSFAAGDLADVLFVERMLEEHGVDRVAHLAAAVSSVANADPLAATRTNCLGTVALLEACRRRGVRRVAMCSSVSVYAPENAYSVADLPLTETALLGFAPGSPLYGSGKAYLEAAGRWYRQEHGMEISGVRASFIASAGKISRPPLGNITGACVDAPACGLPVRVVGPHGRVPYVYVEDVVEQLWVLLTAPDEKLAAGPFFNTGSTIHTVGEIMVAVQTLIPDANVEIGESPVTDLTFGMPTDFSDQLFVDTFGVSRRYDLMAGIGAQIAEARRWPGLFPGGAG